MKKLFLLLMAVLTVSLGALAQNRTVTGTVIDDADGEPIAGASVVPVGESKGVISDADGQFVIQVPNNVRALTISYIGYASQTVTIGRGPIMVRLKSAIETKDEVIVVAYGTTTKGAYTGSAGTVSAAQLENTQVSNVTNALSGKVAGVQTLSSNGQPGKGSTVRIRGVGSINATSNPLYVVDGMPLEDADYMNTIPSSDIQSITVLKDAASTALYGARGANGVILVTTKKGKSGQATVTVDMKWGANTRSLSNYDVIKDERQYLETIYQALVNKGRLHYGVSGAQNLNNYANANLWSSLGYQTWTIPEGELAIGQDGKFNPNATRGYTRGNYYFEGDDWEKECLMTGLRQEYNMSISGGTDRLNFYISGSYLGDEGIIKNSHFNRFSTRATVDYQAKDWLKVGTSLAYTYSNTANPGDQTVDASSSTGNAFNTANNLGPAYPFWIRLASTKQIAYNQTYGKPIYDYGDGADYGWGPTGMSRNVLGQSNPIGALSYDTTDYLTDALDAKWYAILTPLKGLTINGTVGYFLANERLHAIQNGVYGQFTAFGGAVQQESDRNRSINLQLLADYSFTVAQNNNFNVMVGFENNSYLQEFVWGSGNRLYNPTWPFLDNVIDDKNNGGGQYTLTHRGYMGRLRYDYAGRYYLTASVRHDGSSRFHPDHRWGTFWSASAGWDISKESFMQEYSDIVDILKFKFSYGENGNDGIGARFLAYADQYQIGGGDGVWNDGSLVFKGNKDISWEKSQAINTGFDFSFKQGLVSGSVEYYQRTVDDMLINLPVAPSLGYSSVPYNVGKMRNNGFEIDLNVRPIATKNITLDISANLTMGWNKVLRLDPSILTRKVENWNPNSEMGWLSGSRIFIEGESMYNMYLVEYAGVNPETGKPEWWTRQKDVDEKGNTYYTDVEVRTDNWTDAYNANRKPTGNLMPKGYGGFGFDLQAYGFDLSMAFSYQFGGRIYDNAYAGYMSNYGTSSMGYNLHKDLLNAWTPENKTSNIPVMDPEAAYSAGSSSTRFLISSNYLSLNNITLGYTLPAKWTTRVFLNNVRLYFSAENVALWSKRKGLDPRQSYTTSDNATYSPIRSISGGIRVSF